MAATTTATTGSDGGGAAGGSVAELNAIGDQLTQNMRDMMEFQIRQQIDQNPLRAAESNAKAARVG